MRSQFCLGITALITLAASASATDVLLTRKIHTDAYKMGGREIAAKESTQTLWMSGKDRMRVEVDDMTMVIRLDQKKMYILDVTQKVANVIDLPFDMMKYVPAEMAPMMEKNAPMATVTPTEETRKIGTWNARRFAITTTSPQGMASKEEVWTTKEVGVDLAAYMDMSRQIASMRPGGAAMADEMRKLDGITVMANRVRTMNGAEIKSHEELTSVEQKDAPAGSFEVPADYTQKPFDPMSEMRARGPMGKK